MKPATWIKARESNGNGGNNCVEAARLPDGTIGVRHSKTPDGPILAFTQTEWDAFLTGVTTGDFNQL